MSISWDQGFLQDIFVFGFICMRHSMGYLDMIAWPVSLKTWILVYFAITT